MPPPLALCWANLLPHLPASVCCCCHPGTSLLGTSSLASLLAAQPSTLAYTSLYTCLTLATQPSTLALCWIHIPIHSPYVHYTAFHTLLTLATQPLALPLRSLRPPLLPYVRYAAIHTHLLFDSQPSTLALRSLLSPPHSPEVGCTALHTRLKLAILPSS